MKETGAGISAEKIRQALENPEKVPENLQPLVIANYDIDLSKVVEFTSCFLNDAWAPKVKELLASGWIAFRIQTELYVDGHETKIYFAKMAK